jgi:hypothetical protein
VRANTTTAVPASGTDTAGVNNAYLLTGHKVRPHLVVPDVPYDLWLSLIASYDSGVFIEKGIVTSIVSPSELLVLFLSRVLVIDVRYDLPLSIIGSYDSGVRNY